jgi:hypothetical protein
MKSKWRPQQIVFIALIILHQVQSSVSPLNLERIHLVDIIDTNTLFRGNQPLDSNGTFAYDELRKFLQIKALSEGGFQLPQDYILYDIR